jgi:hypothetical protein
VTKLVLVGADMIGWKKMSQFNGKVLMEFGQTQLPLHTYDWPNSLAISYLTYFLPHFHLSFHLDDFRHPEAGGSTFLQNIRTNKKHITWYKIPKDDLNLYLTTRI